MSTSASANPAPASPNATAVDVWEHSLPYRMLMQELALRHKDVLDGRDIERLLVDWETAQRKVQKLRDLPEANLEEYAAALQDCATKEQPLKKILHAAETTALCFSGGGIRSASFGLGVLTQLARLSRGAGENGVLNKIDYVSTVSGGGYVGSWFTGWLRAKNLDRIKALGNASGSAEVSQPANPSALDQIIEDLGDPPPTGADPEPSPLRHLRDYTSYLAPRSGLLSADTWTLVAIFLRNLLLNWGILIPAFAALLLLPVFNTYLFSWVTSHFEASSLLWTAGILALASFLYIAWHLPGNYEIQPAKAGFAGFGVPLFLSAWCLSASFAVAHNHNADFQKMYWKLLIVAGVSHVGLVAGRIFRARAKGGYKRAPHFVRAVSAQFFVALGSAFFVAWLLWLLALHVGPVLGGGGDIRLFISVSFPLILSCFALTAVLLNGLSAQFDAEEDREWWSRSGAFVLMGIILWPLVHLLVLYGHEITQAAKVVFLGLPGQVSIPALTGLIGGLASWAGFSPATASGYAKVDLNKLSGAGKFLAKRELLIPALGALFFVFLGIALTQANDLLSRLIGGTPYPVSIPTPALVIDFAAALAVALVLNVFVNVNTFSLHAMYRSRLIRSYLGASNPRRRPNPFTNFDPGDNFAMKEAPADSSAPLHIVNIALNVVATKKLAWQQRKAESFTVSALHSGSFRVGYRPTKEYAGTNGISLGTAMAISGAAASPNMGYHSSPILSLVMTFFNARLGWWLPNPGPKGNHLWGKNSPVFSLFPLLNESLGHTTDESRWVYLSDGGHFENLALYEMVLRRCKRIIVVDGSADPSFNFEDLGNAVRKIFIDLGVPIDLDPAKNADPANLPRCVSLQPGSNAHNRHCFVMTIRYSCVDGTPAKEDGTLLYIKASLNDNEPADVTQYAKTHPEFPHESTANQFFNEAQFESYVRLGAHIVEEIMGGGAGGDQPTAVSLDDLFNAAQGKLKTMAAGAGKKP
jgi:patatin-like phospholipase